MRALACSLLTAAALAGCGREPSEAPSAASSGASGPNDQELIQWLGFEPPETARLGVFATLWDDARAPRSASDGGGSVRLVNGDVRGVVGRPVRIELEFEAGPGGVAEGGALYLQAPPFWGWSTPQTEAPTRLGYTTVETDAEGVVLEPRTLDEQLLAIAVRGRALAAGERVRIVYGDGAVGARADRFAEGASIFTLAVDGDGDGVRERLGDPVRVPVDPAPPVRLLAHLPATARPGETVELRLALVDGRGNRSGFEWGPGRSN